MTSMKRAPFFLILALLPVAGCGLRDYETRIDDQRKRLKVLDEESRYIGEESIEFGQVETKERKTRYWPFDMFLRLPQEMSVIPAATFYTSNGQDPRLYKYASGTSLNYLMAAGWYLKKEKAKDAKDARAQEWTGDKFRDLVRGALMDYYRKEFKFNPRPNDFPAFDSSNKSFGKVQKRPITDRGEELPPIDYDAIAFVDSFNNTKTKEQLTRFNVYFYRAGSKTDAKQVAIIVQYPVSWQADEKLTGVDWSLKTLELNNASIADKREALEARQWAKR